MGDGRDEASTTGSSVEGRFGSSSLGAARAATLVFREKAGGAGFAPAPLVAGGASRLACGEERATAGEEVKAEFQKKAEADKDRYQQEMDDYQQKLYEQDGSLMGVGASNNAV